MLKFKNRFLWSMALYKNFQNPVEKFDREFWQKIKQASIKEKIWKRDYKAVPASKIENQPI